MNATGTHKPKTRSRTQATRRVPREYTRAEKVAAVTAILTVAPDKPNGKRAIEAAKQTGVDVNPATLFDWVQAYRSEVMALLPVAKTDQEIVEETHNKTIEQMKVAQSVYLEHTLDPEVVAKASARDSAVVVGIMTDHVAKATAALPNSTVTLVQRLAERAALRGLTVDDMLQGMISAADAQAARTAISILANTDGETHAALPSGEK